MRLRARTYNTPIEEARLAIQPMRTNGTTSNIVHRRSYIRYGIVTSNEIDEWLMFGDNQTITVKYAVTLCD